MNKDQVRAAMNNSVIYARLNGFIIFKNDSRFSNDVDVKVELEGTEPTYDEFTEAWRKVWNSSMHYACGAKYSAMVDTVKMFKVFGYDVEEHFEHACRQYSDSLHYTGD